ncbi:hypothetical protein Tco_0333097 [Tanacetum coccineum]
MPVRLWVVEVSPWLNPVTLMEGWDIALSPHYNLRPESSLIFSMELGKEIGSITQGDMVPMIQELERVDSD